MTDLARLLAESLVAGLRDPLLAPRDPDLLLLAELDARYSRWKSVRTAWPPRDVRSACRPGTGVAPTGDACGSS